MGFSTRRLGIDMNQGDDFEVTITINDSTGAPVDITGYQFAGEMKLNTESTTGVAAEFEFTIQDQTTNKGQVLWSLPNSVTSTLGVSVSDAERKQRLTTPYVFDVKMEDTLNVVTRIVEGIMYVSPEVTQEAP